MGYDGYQLSRAWGDLFEIKYYLKYFVPRLLNLETVYIPISYFTFSWDNASVKQLNIRRTQMYTVIPAWHMDPSDLKNFIIGRGIRVFPIQSILRKDNWQGVFNALIHGSKKESNELAVQLDLNCEYKSKIELEKNF